jgi:hypothetical protein
MTPTCLPSHALAVRMLFTPDLQQVPRLDI